MRPCGISLSVFISFSIMSCRLISVIGNSKIPSFLRLNSIPLCVCCIYHNFIIHSSINRQLCCFHSLTTVNDAAERMRWWLSPQDSDFICLHAVSALAFLPQEQLLKNMTVNLQDESDRKKSSLVPQCKDSDSQPGQKNNNYIAQRLKNKASL